MKRQKILIFGHSGYIGKSVVNLANSKNLSIIGVGRKKGCIVDNFYSCDYKDYDCISKVLAELDFNDLSSIVFCQRARNKDGNTLVENFHEEMAIELNPYLAVKKRLQTKIERTNALNIVSLTSNAAFRPALDVRFNYQIIKSAQQMAGISLGYLKTAFPVYSNIISFGEIKNSDISIHSDWHNKLFDLINLTLPGKDIISSRKIAEMILLLCNADQLGLNGQVLYADSGLHRLSNESLLRAHTTHEFD